MVTYVKSVNIEEIIEKVNEIVDNLNIIFASIKTQQESLNTITTYLKSKDVAAKMPITISAQSTANMDKLEHEAE
jgi:glycine cleavage system regulatory protein